MRHYIFLTAAVLLLTGPAGAQTSTDSSLQRSPDVAALPLSAPVGGCSHPFGLREGQNLEYQLLDAKGKATGSLRYRVLNIGTETAGSKKKPKEVTTVRLKSGLYDLTNQVLQQQDVTFRCTGDTTFTDGLAEINYEGLKAFRDRLFAYKSQPLAWPNRPTAGSGLPAGGVVVQVSSPSVAIAKVSTKVRQRKVLAGPAPVTVPAGTFSCYAVESQRELATAARADLVLKTIDRQVDYYDPASGIVKTEYYDKSGKLLQSRVLSKH